MKELLNEKVFVFFLGMVFGLMITGVIVGDKMIPKALLKNKQIYMDGKMYELREMK
jgi:hypothetical protein